MHCALTAKATQPEYIGSRVLLLYYLYMVKAAIEQLHTPVLHFMRIQKSSKAVLYIPQ